MAEKFRKGGKCIMDGKNPEREMKFITLKKAIDGFSNAVEGVGDLINEMQDGPIPPCKTTATKQAQSFQFIYDESAGRIMEITERLRKMTEEIRTRLF